MDHFERRYYFMDDEDFWERCFWRLQQDFELDPEDAELVLHMRRQVIDLQRRIRQLEGELRTHEHRHNLRLARYREITYEADWDEE
jgi:hypothetical protein